MATKAISNTSIGVKFDSTGLTSSLDKIKTSMKTLDTYIKSGTSGFNAMGNSSESLKLKINGLTEKMELQRKKIALLKTSLDESIASKGTDAKETQYLAQQYNNAITSLNKMEIELQKANKELKNTPNILNNVSSKLTSFGDKIAGLGSKLTLGLTAPLVAVATMGVKYNADMEQYQAGLETMLGSAEKATKMLVDLKTMANKTPFETTDLIKASQTMLAFGMSSTDTMSALKMLGDVSMGNKDKLGSLTLAFAQVQSTGRLMGQDLLQMVGQGFNPLQIISEKTGRSMAELKKDMEKGAISADMVTESFKTATSEGGRFYGAMDKQSQTLAGRMSTIKDQFSETIGEFTSSLLPVITEVLSGLSDLIDKFNNLSDAQKETIGKIALLLIALGPILAVIGNISKVIGVVVKLIAPSGALRIAIRGIITAVTTLATTLGLPVLAIVGIIGAITAGIVLIVKFRKQIGEFISNVWNSITGFISNVWNAIPKFFSNIGKSISDFISKLPETLAYWFGFIIGRITKFFIDVALGIVNFIYKIPSYIEAFINFWKELPSKLWSALKLAVNKIGDFFTNMWNSIVTETPKLLNKFVNFWKELPGKLKQIGTNIVDGLFNGIKNSWENLKKKTKKLLDSFVKGIKNGLGIKSPSKLLADEVGQWIPKGISVGIDANADSVKNSLDKVKSLTTGMGQSYQYGLGAVSNSKTTNTNTYNSPININIKEFNNTRNQDVKEFVKEIEFYRKQVVIAKGGVA
ncbi:MAG: phage tail tape measure protein [Bacteroidales bacterium]|nr:phage tail tape measure protein [Bacteroidales bacterium]